MTSISSNALISFGGIESGLDTQAIINALVAADEGPLTHLETNETTINSQVGLYQAIESQLQSLQSAATAVSAPNAFASAVSAKSSNAAVATATTGTGATPGSTTFSVDQLATADTLVSNGTVASANDVVASGNLLLASGGSGLGIGSITGSGLTVGAHTIAVTQASSGATVVGTSPLAGSTSITAANDQLTVSIDGSPSTFTIAHGNYTAQQLATAIGTASGGLLTARTGAGGALVLGSTEQGSQATLQVGSGSANATLGLSASGTVTGTDGVITVDGQANTVTDIAASGFTPVVLTSGSGGTVAASLTPGGLSAGSLTAQNVSVGNGSLSSVVAAINSAGVGMTAEALDVGTNSFALAVSANATGAANDVSIDPTTFAGSSLGTLSTTIAGQNSIISLGGPGGYQVQSSSDTVTGVLPGVSIALAGVSASPVTVSVSADGQAAAATVQTFVNAANTVLQTISTDTAFDAKSGVAGPLNGDFQLNALAQQILGVVAQAVGTSGAIDAGTAASAAGVSIDGSTGQINFDADTFAADFVNNPGAVEKMFTQGGSFLPAGGSPSGPGDVSFAYGAPSTVAGSYAVVINQSASEATDNGVATFASPSSTVAAPETYTITANGQSATFGVSGGETLAQVASGLDQAFAQAGLGLSAQVVGGGPGYSIQLTSAAYGSAAGFSVTSSGADELGLGGASFAGADVAGTINGVAATGVGQVLAAPTSDPTLAGLSLLVTTPGITAPTSIGTFTYTPGLAGGVAGIALSSSEPGGELPIKVTSLQQTSTQLGNQITVEQQLVLEQQQQLEDEFNHLEATLASLKGESSYLSSAFGSSGSLGSLVSNAAGSSTSGGSGSSGSTGG